MLTVKFGLFCFDENGKPTVEKVLAQHQMDLPDALFCQEVMIDKLTGPVAEVEKELIAHTKKKHSL